MLPLSLLENCSAHLRTVLHDVGNAHIAVDEAHLSLRPIERRQYLQGAESFCNFERVAKGRQRMEMHYRKVEQFSIHSSRDIQEVGCIGCIVSGFRYDAIRPTPHHGPSSL